MHFHARRDLTTATGCEVSLTINFNDTGAAVASNAQPLLETQMRDCNAVLLRSFGVSSGVMARNAGTVASGSTITNSELAASRMYSSRLMKPN